MAVARDPGNRAKVAVRATEEGIDAVGTCVGVKGIRVQTIVGELDDEKIDLLEWSEDPSVFIANALGARVGVRRVELNEGDRSALVIVPDDQLSLAIGQRGQNARLAAKLTGWKVDIKGESEASVSIDELFKPEDSDNTGTQTSDSEEERSDQTQQEQETVDASDSTEAEQVVDLAEGVKIDADADTLEAEVVETSDEEIEADTSVAPERDDFDTKS